MKTAFNEILAYITVSKIFNEICNVIFKDYYIL